MAPDGSGRLWTAPDGCGRLRAAPVGGKRPPIVSEGYVCLWLRILKTPTDSGRLWTAPDGILKTPTDAGCGRWGKTPADCLGRVCVLLSVGAAVFDGAAPIAQSCGDRLYSHPAAFAGSPPTLL